MGNLLGDGKPTPKKPGPKRGPRSAVRGKRLKDGRIRRSPEQLEALKNRIWSEVRKQPGARAESLAQALGLKTKDITLPISQLLAEKRLTKRGKLRGTGYFPTKGK